VRRKKKRVTTQLFFFFPSDTEERNEEPPFSFSSQPRLREGRRGGGFPSPIEDGVQLLVYRGEKKGASFSPAGRHKREKEKLLFFWREEKEE